MSSYKILCAWLNSHEDFIKSKGFNINQIKKYVKAKLMDSEKVLRVLEKKYAKYSKNQYEKYEQEKDEIVIDTIPEPTINERYTKQNTNIKLIENENINEKTIEIWFKRGSKTLIKNIKQTIINKLNEIKTTEGVYFQIFYKTEGHLRATTYSLNNNIGLQEVMNLLQGETFELVNNYVESKDDVIIKCSDTNKDNINRLTLDMITGIRITHK